MEYNFEYIREQLIGKSIVDDAYIKFSDGSILEALIHKGGSFFVNDMPEYGGYDLFYGYNLKYGKPITSISDPITIAELDDDYSFSRLALINFYSESELVLTIMLQAQDIKRDYEYPESIYLDLDGIRVEVLNSNNTNKEESK